MRSVCGGEGIGLDKRFPFVFSSLSCSVGLFFLRAFDSSILPAPPHPPAPFPLVYIIIVFVEFFPPRYRTLVVWSGLVFGLWYSYCL